MINILKIGENATHDSTFIVDRPLGHPAYLLLLIKTPASFFIDAVNSSEFKVRNHSTDNLLNIPKDCAVIFKTESHLSECRTKILLAIERKSKYSIYSFEGIRFYLY